MIYVYYLSIILTGGLMMKRLGVIILISVIMMISIIFIYNKLIHPIIIIKCNNVGSIPLESNEMKPYGMFNSLQDSIERDKIQGITGNIENKGNILYTFEHKLIQLRFEKSDSAKEFVGGPYRATVTLSQETIPNTVFIYYIDSSYKLAIFYDETPLGSPKYSDK